MVSCMSEEVQGRSVQRLAATTEIFIQQKIYLANRSSGLATQEFSYRGSGQERRWEHLQVSLVGRGDGGNTS